MVARDGKIEGVFIVGCPRSGSTLLQTLLATQKHIATFTESHFFDATFKTRTCRRLQYTILTRPVRKRINTFLEENRFSPTEFTFPDIPEIRPLLPFYGGKCANAFLDLLAEMAHRRNAECWIEKTPSHLHYVRYIHKITNKRRRIKFLHIIRKGEDVVASLYEASYNGEPRSKLTDALKGGMMICA